MFLVSKLQPYLKGKKKAHTGNQKWFFNAVQIAPVDAGIYLFIWRKGLREAESTAFCFCWGVFSVQLF